MKHYNSLRCHDLAQFFYIVKESTLKLGLIVYVDGTFNVPIIELVVESTVYDDNWVNWRS